MRGAVLVAIMAAVGNMLQGWDNATIAGAVIYIKKEFKLDTSPTMEGLTVAMSLIGATFITTFSGPVSDWLGRRPMMIISSVLYFVGGLVMFWSPSVYVLLLGRLLDGFGVGLAVTLVPVYISETAPSEIRGLLNTLPQFTGSGGMFLSYCMVFGMSLMDSPNWRLMLGILSIPSVVYFVLTIAFLPESPRWLVSKGRMSEAKQVLQRLRGREDVSGELALLIEGLGVGGDTSIEEYIISSENETSNSLEDKDRIMLYGPEEGPTLVARPLTGQSTLGLVSHQGSTLAMDPLVTLFGSVHEQVPETGTMRSMIFPTFGSMFVDGGKNDQWDEVSPEINESDYHSDNGGCDSEKNLLSPLLSRQTTGTEKGVGVGVGVARRLSSLTQPTATEAVSTTDIGGGWQLAWKRSEVRDVKGGGFQRIYLHQENIPGSRHGSLISLTGGDLHAAALVSKSTLFGKDDLLRQNPLQSVLEAPPETARKGPSWVDLCEPGVKHALFVGIAIQILQQFSGINGVLYYTPQILEQAGVGVLLANMGLGSDSASLLISGVTTLLMLPSIGFAMRLMDIAGRRWLLLSTLPLLITTLIALILGNIIPMGSVPHAISSTISVVVYFCCFVMGFGPIPNILCSEIFPTRVRGLCIAICALTFWICDIIVTYSLPIMLNSVGLAGVFGIYAVVCIIAWVFVYIKVPETKGMPLEVISEFFSVGAKQATKTQ
ncbi:Major facilitator, sugar transporter-like [Dillenia turbinata]|uniref:Major facilitator, sugar transporter-like n=1 Tax=Dillenia turbinata TaxID=194707 RepID=A0AAN8V085_9MAGN